MWSASQTSLQSFLAPFLVFQASHGDIPRSEILDSCLSPSKEICFSCFYLTNTIPISQDRFCFPFYPHFIPCPLVHILNLPIHLLPTDIISVSGYHYLLLEIITVASGQFFSVSSLAPFSNCRQHNDFKHRSPRYSCFKYNTFKLHIQSIRRFSIVQLLFILHLFFISYSPICSCISFLQLLEYASSSSFRSVPVDFAQFVSSTAQLSTLPLQKGICTGHESASFPFVHYYSELLVNF